MTELSRKNPRSAWDRAFPVAAGVGVIAVGFAVFGYLAARRAEAELGASRSETAAARERLRDLKQQGAADLQAAAELQAELKHLESLRPASAPAPGPRFEDGYEAGRQFMLAHPEVQKMLDRARVDLANSWPKTAARAAGFSEAQVNQYAELFARQKMSPPFSVDGVRLPVQGDIGGDVQGEQLRALVGDALFAKYEAYMGDRSGMYTSEVAAAASAATGVPLMPGQSQALRDIFAAAQRPFDWEALTRQAAAVLSPAQMPAFEAVRDNRSSSDDVSARRRELMEAAVSKP